MQSTLEVGSQKYSGTENFLAKYAGVTSYDGYYLHNHYDFPPAASAVTNFV
jgi:hypothetical protein